MQQIQNSTQEHALAAFTSADLGGFSWNSGSDPEWVSRSEPMFELDASTAAEFTRGVSHAAVLLLSVGW